MIRSEINKLQFVKYPCFLAMYGPGYELGDYGDLFHTQEACTFDEAKSILNEFFDAYISDSGHEDIGIEARVITYFNGEFYEACF